MAADKTPRVAHQGEGGGTESLPPAGDERREVLARRADALVEKAEELGAAGGQIDPDAFHIENEIGRYFNHLEVPHRQEGYAYKWEQRDPNNRFGNFHFLAAQTQGWERVLFGDPDAKGLEHCRHPDGSIIVGDTILMRIRYDRYIQLRRAEYHLARRQEGAIDSELMDIAGRRGVRVLKDEEIGGKEHGRWSAAQESRAAHAAAQKLALQELDKQIRGGHVPGRPSPGR